MYVCVYDALMWMLLVVQLDLLLLLPSMTIFARVRFDQRLDFHRIDFAGTIVINLRQNGIDCMHENIKNIIFIWT